MSEKQLRPLWIRLKNLTENPDEDPEEIIDVCDRILRLAPTSKDALLAKITALTFLGGDSVDPALTLLHEHDLVNVVPFLYAYNLYSAKQYDEALEVIEQHHNDDDEGLTMLKAQTLFRLERFGEAASVFEELLADDPDDIDLRTNYIGCLAAMEADLTDAQHKEATNVGEDEFTDELVFNSALLNIKMDEVADKIIPALEMSAENVPASLVPRYELLLGVINAKLGETDAAHTFNEKVRLNEGSGKALRSLAQNNDLAIVGFDSESTNTLKKLKRLSSTELEKRHRNTVLFNKGVVAIQVNHFIDALKCAADLPAEERIIIETAVALKEGKVARAESKLKAFLRDNESAAIRQIAAQLLINAKRFSNAAAILANHGDARTLAVVNELANETAVAKKHYMDLDEPTLVFEFMYRQGAYADAVKYHNQHTQALSNPNMMAIYMLCLCEVDVEAAFSMVSENVLGELSVSGNAKQLEALQAQELATLIANVKKMLEKKKIGGTVQKKKRRKKRKRKNKPAKNFDPNVEPDPYRWMSVAERAEAMRSQGRRNRNRAKQTHQGATNVNDRLDMRAKEEDKKQQPQQSGRNGKNVRNKGSKGRKGRGRKKRR
ncbi:hypothetical protein PCE1_004970 [Barthelona sp. PCE]